MDKFEKLDSALKDLRIELELAGKNADAVLKRTQEMSKAIQDVLINEMKYIAEQYKLITPETETLIALTERARISISMVDKPNEEEDSTNT